MLKAEEKAKQLHLEQGSEEKNSSNWDCSEQAQMEERPVDDQNIDDLHLSLSRLRQFVGSLSKEQAISVPSCVEEYCDNMAELRVRSGEQVVLIAQRRLNKMLRNRKIKRNWNNEDIILLVWLICKQVQKHSLTHFSELSKEDWEFISQMISGSSWQKCKFKWLSLKKVKLVTHKWSKLQSNLLSDLISDLSKINWKLVAQSLYQRNPSKNKVFRTPKQCRQHWNCFLNPNIQKGPWTIHQDRRLLEYVLELQGSKKWSEISKFMDGRTENALKNRYNLLLNRQKKTSGHLTQKRLIKICLNRLMLQEGQEEHLQLPSSLAMEPESEHQQVALRQNHQMQRRPIVPTIVEPSYSTQVAYHAGYEPMINYMSGTLGQQNPFFISFVFPNQFS